MSIIDPRGKTRGAVFEAGLRKRLKLYFVNASFLHHSLIVLREGAFCGAKCS